MSGASASSSNASPMDEAHHGLPTGDVEVDPSVLVPTRRDGLIVLWPEEAEDVGSVLSDYEYVLPFAS